MRLVLAIISFALAALMMGYGIAQRTILLGDDQLTATLETTSDAPITIIDGAVLNTFDRKQTIAVSGAESNFAAYGRTSDIMAWVGDASHNVVSFDPETNDFTSKLVEGTESEVPDPSGSDLWVADFREEKTLDFTVDVPSDISLIIVADGIEPAPSDVSVTWPIDNSTPWAFPLLIGGAFLLLVGLVFLLLAIHHVRKARGPRRKQTKLPRVPKPPAYRAITSPKAGTPVVAGRGRRGRGFIALPTVLVGALLLGGCTAEPMVATDSTATALAASEEDAAEGGIPAVTVPQAKRIVARVAADVEAADAAGDATLLANRMDGPALALRTANYKIRTVDSAVPLPAPIPSEPVRITLPQKNDAWPRTVFVVLQDEVDATVAPTALMLIQDSPRDQYKVHYAIQLEPGAVIPDVAPANVGTFRLAPDNQPRLLSVAPDTVGVNYADVLMNDVDSEFVDQFDTESDLLRALVGRDAKQVRISKIPPTASLTFATTVGTGQIIALATNDGGAIVSFSLNETETISPVEQGAAVTAPGQVAALLGKALSTKGITATYTDQVLFFVPGVDKGGKIVLLGYSQGLTSASEL
jgi:hypothetical protein